MIEWLKEKLIQTETKLNNFKQRHKNTKNELKKANNKIAFLEKLLV